MNQLPNKLNPKIKPGQRIVIVGLGGVGEKVARNVALFVASLGDDATLVLVDGDQFEPSNATRMFFDGFGNKAEVVARSLLPGFLEPKLDVVVVREYVAPSNISGVVREDDIVLLCLDNHASRKLISDWCGTLKNVVLISGGNDGVEPDKGMRGTYGNVQIYIRENGQGLTPSLTEFHPEIDKPEDKPPDKLSCIEKMQSTPQLLISNLTVATHMLAAFSLYLSDALRFAELAFDWADASTNMVLEKDL